MWPMYHESNHQNKNECIPSDPNNSRTFHLSQMQASAPSEPDSRARCLESELIYAAVPTPKVLFRACWKFRLGARSKQARESELLWACYCGAIIRNIILYFFDIPLHIIRVRVGRLVSLALVSAQSPRRFTWTLSSLTHSALCKRRLAAAFPLQILFFKERAKYKWSNFHHILIRGVFACETINPFIRNRLLCILIPCKSDYIILFLHQYVLKITKHFVRFVVSFTQFSA